MAKCRSEPQGLEVWQLLEACFIASVTRLAPSRVEEIRRGRYISESHVPRKHGNGCESRRVLDFAGIAPTQFRIRPQLARQ